MATSSLGRLGGAPVAGSKNAQRNRARHRFMVVSLSQAKACAAQTKVCATWLEQAGDLFGLGVEIGEELFQTIAETERQQAGLNVGFDVEFSGVEDLA
jgi:hypothetical protein